MAWVPAYLHLLRARDAIDRRFAEPLDVATLARTVLASRRRSATTPATGSRSRSAATCPPAERGESSRWAPMEGMPSDEHMATIWPMARTQTLVQFSADLLERLDRFRAREGRSRSDVVREAVERYLAEDREAEIDRLVVDAYGRAPHEDPWGEQAAVKLIATEPW